MYSKWFRWVSLLYLIGPKRSRSSNIFQVVLFTLRLEDKAGTSLRGCTLKNLLYFGNKNEIVKKEDDFIFYVTSFVILLTIHLYTVVGIWVPPVWGLHGHANECSRYYQLKTHVQQWYFQSIVSWWYLCFQSNRGSYPKREKCHYVNILISEDLTIRRC